jgi:hypothetical protein
MSFWDALNVLRRRWKLAVPALLLVVGVAFAAFLTAPPSYMSRSDVLFLPSTESPDSTTPVNPYMGLGATLGSTADVITRVVTDPRIVRQIAASGGTAAYQVVPDQTTSAPVLIVTSRARSAQVTARTTNMVVAQMKQTLQQQQQAAGAPRGTWVSANVLVAEGTQRLWKGQVRAGIAAFAGCTLLFLALLFGLEARRRQPLGTSLGEEGDSLPGPRSSIRRKRNVAARGDEVPAPVPDEKARRWA